MIQAGVLTTLHELAATPGISAKTRQMAGGLLQTILADPSPEVIHSPRVARFHSELRGETLAVAWLKATERIELQIFGARSIARYADNGKQAMRDLGGLGAVESLVRLLRGLLDEHEREEEGERRGGSGGGGSNAQREGVTARRSLLSACVHALLNLSCERGNQHRIGVTGGLELLLQVAQSTNLNGGGNYDGDSNGGGGGGGSDAGREREQKAGGEGTKGNGKGNETRAMASAALVNLLQHGANRTRFVKVELGQKTGEIARLAQAAASAPSPSTPQSPWGQVDASRTVPSLQTVMCHLLPRLWHTPNDALLFGSFHRFNKRRWDVDIARIVVHDDDTPAYELGNDTNVANGTTDIAKGGGGDGDGEDGEAGCEEGGFSMTAGSDTDGTDSTASDEGDGQAYTIHLQPTQYVDSHPVTFTKVL
jgi:hypothetical protein